MQETGLSAPGDTRPERHRRVVSFQPRGGRLNHVQHRAWDAHAADWYLEPEPGLRLADSFGRSAPLVVEIGSGMGQATAAMAAARPEVNLLAIEVYRPGIAQTFHHLAKLDVATVRVLRADAVQVLGDLLEPGSVAEIWLFFPDPWPKTRHHKRRLVTAEFADLVASRLAPGGTFRLATDWKPYADQMLAVLSACTGLVNAHDGWAPRPAFRPETRFERRGLAEGREIRDLEFRRR